MSAKRAKIEGEGEATKVKAVCCIPGCGKEAKIRGLCARCYTAARKLVTTGKATWEALEASGLAKPATSENRGVFAAAFAKVSVKIEKAASRKKAKAAKVKPAITDIIDPDEEGDEEAAE